MKILSVAVPCYNSSAYMEKCIKSLLPGGEDIEILLVDDGSQKDNTLGFRRLGGREGADQDYPQAEAAGGERDAGGHVPGQFYL